VRGEEKSTLLSLPRKEGDLVLLYWDQNSSVEEEERSGDSMSVEEEEVSVEEEEWRKEGEEAIRDTLLKMGEWEEEEQENFFNCPSRLVLRSEMGEGGEG